MPIGTDLREEQKTDPLFPVNLFRNRHTGHEATILPLHWHEHLEIIWMTEGEAVFIVNGQAFTAKPGDLLFVGGGELHTGQATSAGPTEFVAIVFHPDLLAGKGFDPHYIRTIAPLLTGERRLPPHIGTEAPLYAYVAGPVMSAVRELESRETAYEMNAKLYLALAFAQLFRHGAGPQQKPKETARQAERFKPLITYVEQRYAEKISVEDAAKMVNLSPYHFCKSFKKATGHTFGRFLQLIRVGEAERLLLETEMPVTEIAVEVGFCDLHYLNKVFKKIKYCSPSDLRRLR
ncbi:AraC-type DNA-binding protein [Paenibacillus sp. UNCCL117]|uniref:AraC family transcriptional regulator n=1 Tax=unclassified Paenibacillus TaxID=185978 RepID=UPI0008808EE2|nr:MULTISPECIES: AraC family transcriptional regulator [unclassified Paenibacillus]SDD00482.1 AraC-type DNA-binding protein [Paenibacillus sp. cl123]SFW32862.1 AraC-type DNA-binding protein [Paenibacillus sp. UNCCL117]